MHQLTQEHFEHWLAEYGRHSAENDARASAELFSEDARYYENPFEEPLVGKQAIRQYWEAGAANLDEKRSTYEILVVSGNQGVARWRSSFRSVKTGKRFELDCLFVAEFDEAGKCRAFREWWHIRERDQGLRI